MSQEDGRDLKLFPTSTASLFLFLPTAGAFPLLHICAVQGCWAQHINPVLRLGQKGTAAGSQEGTGCVSADFRALCNRTVKVSGVRNK